MAGQLVHENSLDCLKTELDLFSPAATQTSMEKGAWQEYPPSSTLTETGPLEFHVSGAGNEYIDLMHTMLYLKAKIVKEDGSDLPLDETEKDNIVAPINLTLQSLFSQLEVTLNGKIVGHMNTLYPYRAILETILNFNPESTNSHLQSSLFYKDTAGYMDSSDARDLNNAELVDKFNMDACIPAVDADGVVKTPGNKGLNLRYLFFRQNNWVDLIGPLHHDIFQQEKYLLNNVDLGIRLHRSKSSFHLMSPANDPKFRVKISDAALFVRKVTISDHVFLAHQNALLRTNAVYPLSHVVMKSFSIPRGNLVGPSDNIFVGQLPIELVVAFVDASAANGSYDKNPYNFQNLQVKQFMVKYNGVQVPAKPLPLNYPSSVSGGSQGLYSRAYQSLFSGTGKLFSNKGSIVRRQDFPQGYAIYAFDFRADIGSKGHYSLRRNGTVQVEVQFKQPLWSTVNMIVYGEFDSFMEIGRSREVVYFGV